MPIDIKNIELLLENKKYEEVQALIKEVVGSEISDEEKGAAFVGLASAYIDISNAIDTRYRDALQEAVDGMMAINKAESKTNDKVRIEEVKSSLKA
jgi:hypothetical protein